MLVLGLLLMLLAALVMVGAIMDGGESASLEVFGASFDTTAAGLFIAGAATMLVFLLGAWLASAASSRAKRKRHERKQVKREQRESVERLERERAQLREENERLSQQLSTPGSAGQTGGTSLTGATHPGDSTGTLSDRGATSSHASHSSDDRVIDARSDLAHQQHGTGSHSADNR